MPHILLVDDSDLDRDMYRSILSKQRRNLTFDEATGAQEATQLLQTRRYDCVFLDHLMRDGDGIQVLRAVEGASASPVVMLTASEDPQIAVEALKCGAVDYLMKDRVDAETLVRAFEAAVVKGGQRNVKERRFRDMALLQAVIHQSDDVFLVVDLTDLVLVDASAVGLAKLGFWRSDLVGGDVRKMPFFAEGGWDAFVGAVQRPGEQVDWKVKKPDGEVLETRVRAQIVRVDGRPYLLAQARAG